MHLSRHNNQRCFLSSTIVTSPYTAPPTLGKAAFQILFSKFSKTLLSNFLYKRWGGGEGNEQSDVRKGDREERRMPILLISTFSKDCVQIYYIEDLGRGGHKRDIS